MPMSVLWSSSFVVVDGLVDRKLLNVSSPFLLVRLPSIDKDIASFPRAMCVMLLYDVQRCSWLFCPRSLHKGCGRREGSGFYVPSRSVVASLDEGRAPEESSAHTRPSRRGFRLASPSLYIALSKGWSWNNKKTHSKKLGVSTTMMLCWREGRSASAEKTASNWHPDHGTWTRFHPSPARVDAGAFSQSASMATSTSCECLKPKVFKLAIECLVQDEAGLLPARYRA